MGIQINGTTDTISAVDGNLDINQNATFGGNVTIGGTLTYEDVNNVDALGIVTSRGGFRATTGGIHVQAGISTFEGVVKSTVSTGTAPLIVASTTTVTNLSADLLDGKDTSASGGNNVVLITDGSGHASIGSGTFTSGRINVAGNMQFTAANAQIELNNGGPRFWSPAANTLTVHTGGGFGSSTLERFRITSAGKISTGGLAAPTSDMHIWKSNAGGDVSLRVQNDTSTDSGTTASLYLTTSPTDDFNTFRIQASRATGATQFGYGTVDSILMKSDGDVGINTTSPRTQGWRAGRVLDIHGGSGNVTGELHLGANRGDGTQSVGSINFYDNTQDANHRHIALIEADKTGSTANKRGGDILFYTKSDNVAAPLERFRIKSDGTHTINTPMVYAYAPATTQSLTDATWTKNTWLTTEDIDTDSAFTSSRFTVPANKAGTYYVSVGANLYGNDNNIRNARVAIYKNGSQYARAHSIVNSTSTTAYFQLRHIQCVHSCIMTLAVGDYIENYMYLDVNSGLLYMSSDNDTVRANFLMVYRIS